MTAINDINYGAIVERVVRRRGISITELARRLHVNRRSVYNWFSQPSLSMEIIHEIGCVLGHDFSGDFPESYKKEDFAQSARFSKNQIADMESASYWMNKYITLLEKYNQHLTEISLDENHQLGVDYNLLK